MQTHQYSRRRLSLIVILAILIIIMMLAMLAGCSQPSNDVISVGQASTAPELSAPETTSVSDSVSFGDTLDAELSGVIDLDETSCTVQVTITNRTASDALIEINLDFDTTTSSEESVVPAGTRWHLTYVREQPIVALYLTEGTGISDVNINFTPDYTRCEGSPPFGVGDAQTLERLEADSTTVPQAPVV